MKCYIIIILLFLLKNNSFAQTLKNNEYQKGIFILLNQLNNYRSDLEKMDSICKLTATKNNLNYTRKKTNDSIFPFIINNKLCNEALRRCKENIKKDKDIFKATHLYESFEFEESIHAKRINIKQFNLKDELKNSITSLITDCEPVIGHRDMLLTTNKNYKYIGFGYIIIQKGDKIDLLVFVLTSSLKGLNHPINFNNTYINSSNCITIHRKDLIK